MYVERYFRVLDYFYKQNKLVLNPEKTNILVVAKPAIKALADDIRIVTDKEEVKPSKSIKMLGWETNERLSMDSHYQQVTGKIKCMMSRMEEIKGYMSEKQRLKFANAYMMSILQYGAQFLVADTANARKNYHSTAMMVSRWVKGSYCFRISCLDICKSIKWNLPEQQILKKAILFAHRIQISRKPIQILNQVRMPRTRQKAKISIKYKKNNEKYDRNLISQSFKLYNLLPEDLKSLKPSKLKNAIKKIWISKPD